MNETRAMRSLANKRVIEGLSKHFADTDIIHILGQPHTVASLKASLQEQIVAAVAADKMKAEAQSAMAREIILGRKVKPLRRGIQLLVAAHFGEKSVRVTDFVKQRKAMYKSVSTKRNAADKARATRTARHTMGKRQKAKIRPVVVAPSASGATTPTKSGKG